MSAVTIKDIARLAGVSHATVSRALNGAPGMRPETRARVLELCRQHGYRANRLAQSLSASRTGIISCILPGLDNPLFSETSLIVEQFARQHGYHVMLCHGRMEDANIDQLFDYLIGHRVDGIILFSSSRQAPERIRHYINRVPIVLQGIFDAAACPDITVPTVCADNTAGGRMAAEYLCGLGHRRVVYLGVRRCNVSHMLRYESFRDAAKRLGMSVQVLYNEDKSSTVDAGYRLAKQFFFQNFQETAMFAACDTIALGAMAAAKEFHISIPEDLSLMGFDNISYSSLPSIQLTTIEPCKREVLETTVECLLDLIGSPDREASPPRFILPSLVERATCRKC